MTAPRVVAVIPARGGSKGVPGKNLARVGGVPLVARAVRACAAARTVNRVCVSTDDAGIAGVAQAAGAEVVERPAELAGDEASSESTLLHALDVLAADGVHPEVLLFVQCTSPFVRPSDLDQAVARLREADSVFSAVPSHRFLWRPADGAGDPALVTGVNHDPAVRLRRQDRPVEHLETGAFYALDVAGFRRVRRRFFGRTTMVVVPELAALEIDTPADLDLANALVGLVDPPPTAVDVDVVITDFDGVHTEDRVLVDQHGVEAVQVCRADGLGVDLLRRAGVPLLIVSTETNPVVTARARKLGVEALTGVRDKAGAVRAWLAGHGGDPGRVAYLGNDVNDLEAMATVGWPVAVADARPEVRRAARLVLGRRGGAGAVRELCDLVLAARSPADAEPGDEEPEPARRLGPRSVVDAGGVPAREEVRAGG